MARAGRANARRTAPLRYAAVSDAPPAPPAAPGFAAVSPARALDRDSAGYYAVDRHWRLTYLSDGAADLLGVPRAEAVGRNLWGLLPEAARTRFHDDFHAVMASGRPVALEEERADLGKWLEIRVLPDPDGLAVYYLDVTARRVAQEQARAAAERTALLEAVSGALAATLDAEEAVGRLARLVVPRLADWSLVTLAGEGGRLRDVGWWHRDPARRELVERYAAVRLEALTGEAFVLRALRSGRPAMASRDAEEAIRAVLRPGEATELLGRLAPESIAVFPMMARGHTVGLLSLYGSRERGPLATEDLAIAAEVSGRAALAVDNARAYTTAREAQREAQDANRRLQLLGQVSGALSSTLDREEAMERLARLVVPALADWCVVTLADEGRSWRSVGAAHRDPARQEEVAAYAASQSRAMSAGSPVATALRTGEVVVVAELADDVLRAALPAPEVADMARRLSPHGVAVLPLTAHGETLGAMTLVTTPQRGPHTAAELDTAREVARRAGLTLENARLYAYEQRRAEELQRSLLTAPPSPDHLEIAVRYVPAVQEAQVGGDWYDAFVTPTGATVVVIGDVVGHDTQAAAAMGQIRGLLRGIAYTTAEGPAAVLSRLDAAMKGLLLATTATAVVARLEQDHVELARGETRVRWSNAGHPPPMVLDGGGGVHLLQRERADVLLGVLPGAARAETVTVLRRGATLLLYTDGLVERRGESVDKGLARLKQTLAAQEQRPLEELCDAVLARMLPDGGEDDVALVAVRLHVQDPRGAVPDVPSSLVESDDAAPAA